MLKQRDGYTLPPRWVEDIEKIEEDIKKIQTKSKIFAIAFVMNPIDSFLC
jgi:hypothetical protein